MIEAAEIIAQAIANLGLVLAGVGVIIAVASIK